MGVKWRNDLDTALVILLLLDEHLFVNIKVALESHWLHIIFLFELNSVLASPWHLSAVLRGDILRGMVQVAPSPLPLVLLIKLSSLLEVRSLMEEDERRQCRCREHKLLGVHFFYQIFI